MGSAPQLAFSPQVREGRPSAASGPVLSATLTYSVRVGTSQRKAGVPWKHSKRSVMGELMIQHFVQCQLGAGMCGCGP